LVWLLIHHLWVGVGEGVGWVLGLGLTPDYRLALRLPRDWSVGRARGSTRPAPVGRTWP